MRSNRTRWGWFGFWVAVAALIGIWWWPGLTGSGSSEVVLLSGSPSTAVARETIDRRLREEGFTTEWLIRPIDDCSWESPSIEEFEVFVVLLPPTASCDEGTVSNSIRTSISRVGGARFVPVLSWKEEGTDSTAAKALNGLGIVALDPRVLIGTEGVPQPCLWWDDCPESGTVTTTEDGELTQAGAQRLARFVVAGVL